MRPVILSLFILFFGSQLFAETFLVDECKTDIYFANGVGADSKPKSFRQGKVQVDKYMTNTPSTAQYIGKYDLAFNTGRGPIMDFSEAWFQYLDENPGQKVVWSAFIEAISRATGPVVGGALKISEETIKYLEQNDITAQVQEYRKSIYNGHRVIVLAHSQGNFFTNKAYKTFDTDADKWMQQFFTTVGLATPSSVEIPNSIYLTFDNDPITVLNGAGGKIPNPTRYYHWLPHSGTPVDDASTIPCAGVFLPRGQTPYCSDDGWYAEETTHEEFHDFNYTMSIEPIKGQTYSFLTNGIIEHLTAPSQWKLNDPKDYNCVCSDKLRTVTHLHAPDTLKLKEEVYPFDGSGKLYPVNGKYVKASCGGVSITSKENEDICHSLKDKKTNIANTHAKSKIMEAVEFKQTLHSVTNLPHIVI